MTLHHFSVWLSANQANLLLWVGAICTLGLYSVLYKENRVYRLFEHLFLGLATGYMLAITWTDILLPKWWVPLHDNGEWWWVFAMVIGLFYYFIYWPKHSWLARLMIGFFLGVASGQSFQGFVNDTWPQISSSFKPIIPHPIHMAGGHIINGLRVGGHITMKALNGPDAINNAIFMIILVCVLSYFFFSFEQKHVAVRESARLGRWMLMFSFGAIFGSTIMARLALLIDRMDFLINDFGLAIGGPKHGPGIMLVVILVLVAAILVMVAREKKQEDPEP